MAILIYGPVVNSVSDADYNDVTVSTVDPVSANGKDGDIWLKYTP